MIRVTTLNHLRLFATAEQGNDDNSSNNERRCAWTYGKKTKRSSVPQKHTPPPSQGGQSDGEAGN